MGAEGGSAGSSPLSPLPDRRSRKRLLLGPPRQQPQRGVRGAETAREGPGGRTDPMAAHPTEQRLGSLPVFTRNDFESDWRLVASGGFSLVFQARHRRWPTECAIKCLPASHPTPPGAASHALPFLGGETEARQALDPGSLRGRSGLSLGLRTVPRSVSEFHPVA